MLLSVHLAVAKLYYYLIDVYLSFLGKNRGMIIIIHVHIQKILK